MQELSVVLFVNSILVLVVVVVVVVVVGVVAAVDVAVVVWLLPPVWSSSNVRLVQSP